MTASKTPRLGLMNPVGSDAFITADFSQTFGVLDANPGVPVVANAASRPTSYTTAQHGSMVFQADQGIIWSWNQPTSGSVGAWQRVGNKGFLGQAVNTGTVSTSTTTYANGAVVVSLDVTVPGGRPILVLMSWDILSNTNGPNVFSFWENNSRQFDRYFYNYYGDVASGDAWVYRPPVSSQQNINYKMTIAAYNAASPNGSGTTRMTNGVISAWEM